MNKKQATKYEHAFNRVIFEQLYRKKYRTENELLQAIEDYIGCFW